MGKFFKSIILFYSNFGSRIIVSGGSSGDRDADYLLDLTLLSWSFTTFIKQQANYFHLIVKQCEGCIFPFFGKQNKN